MSEALKKKRTFLYSFVKGLAVTVFHTVAPVRYVHRERLNLEAPYMIIANHQHWCDPAILAVPVSGTQAVFLGKKELAATPFLKKVLVNMHCILVDRHKRDMEAMRACNQALRDGRILIVFPEGTRHHEGQMEQIENGTALLALRGKVPLVPVFIDRPFGAFHVTSAYVGEPIPYGDLLERGIDTETCEALNERMRETFRAMIREAKKS